MGTIRTILALCVVVYHSYTILGAKFIGGRVAVECFFILSGFYMALILEEKYTGKNNSWKKFIGSRLFRLLPLYFLVLILSFSISLLGMHAWNDPYYLGMFQTYWSKMNLFTRGFIILENIVLIGQDLFFFLKLNFHTGGLTLTHDMHLNRPLIASFTFIPQAWTLSMEIIFYMLAPFLFRLRWMWLAGIVMLSLLLKWFIFHRLGWQFDPWTYRFFPAELGFFVAGGLLYRAYGMIKNTRGVKTAGGILMGIILLMIIFYNSTERIGDPKSDFNLYYRHWYFYAVFALSIPFIFHFTRNNTTDRRIGELSFPLYLIHHLVMVLIKPFFFRNFDLLPWFGVTTILISVVVSVLVWLIFLKPMEKLRQKRFAS